MSTPYEQNKEEEDMVEVCTQCGIARTDSQCTVCGRDTESLNGDLIELGLEPLVRLNRDLRAAARELGDSEARFLTDFYYTWQEARKRANNILRASDEPHSIVTWLSNNTASVERLIKGSLGVYGTSSVPGRWLQSITGIGPVISAGLLSHIDITKCPTVGHIWRFAGLDPTVEWLGQERARTLVRELVPGRGDITNDQLVQIAVRTNRRVELIRNSALSYAANPESGVFTRAHLIKALAKRPWNAKLKTLCWKIGESFVKFQNNPKDMYGKHYLERKAYEHAINLNGGYAERAARKLERTNITVREIREIYESGMLPDGHIHESAKRWTVKLFLAHYHHVAYESHYDEPPPKPYILDRGGHTHYIAPPNWPMD